MPGDELFDHLPEQAVPQVFDAGRPRLREPVRDQVELRAVDLDRLIGAVHPARVIWDYVQKLDLSSLERAVRAREHTPGQAPASPPATAGAVALCDQRGRRKRAGFGPALRKS
jgi:hypothetical protein